MFSLRKQTNKLNIKIANVHSLFPIGPISTSIFNRAFDIEITVIKLNNKVNVYIHIMHGKTGFHPTDSD